MYMNKQTVQIKMQSREKKSETQVLSGLSFDRSGHINRYHMSMKKNKLLPSSDYDLRTEMHVNAFVRLQSGVENPDWGTQTMRSEFEILLYVYDLVGF